MVIDTSAMMALLRHEPERARIIAALETHPVRRISAVSLLEAHVVLRARKLAGMVNTLRRFVQEIDAAVMPFDERQALLADMAFARYGKGQGHPAQLNFGDCAVYALASSLGESLLFVGNDFVQTDIQTVLS
jgi:ribonuclease VapC